MSRRVDVSAMTHRWADALAAWAIPPRILDAAARDPWVLPVGRFAARADRAVSEPSGASFERAAEALRDERGSVLDVGAGAGAASLPLASMATGLTAVDANGSMLQAFAERADRLGVEHREVEGRWPDVAEGVPVHDVTVVHHVVFNVADIAPFLLALDAASTRRVVLELPPHHPLSWLNPLWKQFHDLDRPETPIAGDLVEILGAMGAADLEADYWRRSDDSAADGSDRETLAERAAIAAQRLCLPVEREGEVAHALAGVETGYHRDAVTISWTPGSLTA